MPTYLAFGVLQAHIHVYNCFRNFQNMKCVIHSLPAFQLPCMVALEQKFSARRRGNTPPPGVQYGRHAGGSAVTRALVQHAPAPSHDDPLCPDLGQSSSKTGRTPAMHNYSVTPLPHIFSQFVTILSLEKLSNIFKSHSPSSVGEAHSFLLSPPTMGRHPGISGLLTVS